MGDVRFHWGATQVILTALDDQGRAIPRGQLEAHVVNNRRVVLELELVAALDVRSRSM